MRAGWARGEPFLFEVIGLFSGVASSLECGHILLVWTYGPRYTLLYVSQVVTILYRERICVEK